MKNIPIVLLAGLFVCLTACGPNAEQPGLPSDAVSFSEAASSSPEPDPAGPEQSAHDTAAYPFYEDGDFLQKAYDMGYTDGLLETCWQAGHTKESLLDPPLSFQYDVSPDGNRVLYQGATPEGGMLLGEELLCLKDNRTGKAVVLHTERIMPGANRYFSADGSVGIFDSYGGALFDLEGNELFSATLDPEGMGYYIYMPVYNPAADTLVGLGTSYKEGNTPDYADGHAFAWMEASLDGEVKTANRTDILMEVNRYGQILYPDYAGLRDGTWWAAMTTPAGRYVFYSLDLDADFEIKPADGDAFRAAFPFYAGKG